MADLIPTPEIDTILQEQDAYRAAPPAVLPRAVRSVAKPIGFLTNRIIPADVVEAGLKGADWAATGSIRKTAVNHDFSDIGACEEAVREVRRWALGYAVAGGGAAGAFGALGLALDVPATMTLALRTVRLVGLSYGFGADSEAERVYILDILQLAGSNSPKEKSAALERLSKERAEMAPEEWRKIVTLTGQTSGTLAATRRVAATLGVNLSTRKVAQIAPIVGAAVGAGVNAAFLNDVAGAARFAYRERWLAVNEQLVDGTAEQLGEGK